MGFVDMTTLQEYRKKLDVKLKEFDLAKRNAEKERETFLEADESLEYKEEARKILQVSAETVQNEAHARISDVVSRSLKSVFDNPYEFRVVFEQKRGKTEANLVFVRNGKVLTDPINEAAGGSVDIASFALRLACLVLQRPRRRRLLIMDEPFKNVRGSKNRRRVRDLILSLSEDLGVQFILNVDHEAYPQFTLGDVLDLNRGG